MVRLLASLALAFLAAPVVAQDGSKLIEASVETTLVPGPVEYAVLLPPGYAALERPVPLLLDLHGGGGDRRHLRRTRAVYDELWHDKAIPPLVVATPSAGKRSFYMDFKSGKEKWETFVVHDFLGHLRAKYRVRRDRKGTLLTGVSMGGMGSLRMAFKYPGTFAAVAALEPGIPPVLHFKDLRPKHRFWRADRLLEAAYGKPIDAAYWAQNNPASIVVNDAKRLRASGLQVYIEGGDEDQFWLYEGAEFLHRRLWDQRIKHEYHLVRGADHVGPSLAARKRESLKFLARVLNPPPVTRRSRVTARWLNRLKRRLTERDHYSQEAGK